MSMEAERPHRSSRVPVIPVGGITRLRATYASFQRGVGLVDLR